MQNKTIVMLASDCVPTNVVYHAADKQFGIAKVIIENKESKKVFLKRRLKKLGWFTVAGQVLFQLTVAPLLSRFSGRRIDAILRESGLNDGPVPPEKIIRVHSINEDRVIRILQELDPGVIIVNGTRIISKKILSCVHAPFINMHVGITPMYRGVHGGYWSLVNKDAASFGVTIHLVDAGIDTGSILYQETAAITATDNFITYPFLQLAAGVPALMKAVDDAIAGRLAPVQVKGTSKLWYHPALWQYIYNRIFKKVK
jgi:folate-dependent phosphoribosylglycinamide formyltransferase PurN